MRQATRGATTRRAATLATIAVVGALVLALAGCVSAPSVPKPTETIVAPTQSPTSNPTPTPTASIPQFLPDGSATDNLPYFDYVNRRVLAQNPNAVGADFINALITAGFAKSDMQVTADRTSVNLPAGSIQFSVKIQGECIIGQNGAGSDGYHSEVTPPLSTGNCLVGDTVPIH
jgi:hypothetical protein